MPTFSESSRLRWTTELVQLCEAERGVSTQGCLAKLGGKVRDMYKATGITSFIKKLPLSKQARKIGIKFGSSVLGYYKLLRMLVALNFLTAVGWFVWAIVPWFEYWDRYSFEAPAPYNQTTSVINVGDIILNFIGAPSPTIEDKSWFFYSGYPTHFDDYEMGSSYVLLCLGTYMLSLFFVVYLIGMGLSNGNQTAASDSDTRLPMSLYAWDWEVQDPDAVEERMLGCWMQVQAEYHNSMRAYDYFVDQTVRTRQDKYEEWEKTTIHEIEGHDYWVERKDGLRYPVNDLDNIQVILICGMKPRKLRRWVGGFLSFCLCGGSVVGYYFSLYYKEDLDTPAFPYVSSLMVKAINLCIPFTQRKIVKLEKIKSPQDAIKQEVLRVFVIKMTGLVFVFLSLLDITKGDSNTLCPEYLIGSVFLQLLLVDYYVDFALTIGTMLFFRKIVEPPRMRDFVVSTEVINALYRQCLTWMSALYVPMAPFFSFVYMFALFFVKAYCMTRLCKTPSQPMAEDGTGAFYYFMLLATMLVSGVPFFHFMKTKKEQCGAHHVPGCATPFDNSACKTPLESLNLFVHETGMTPGTDWVFSSVILFFLCIALLVIVYLLTLSLWSGRAATARRIDELNAEIKQLRQELRDCPGRPTSPLMQTTIPSRPEIMDPPPAELEGEQAQAKRASVEKSPLVSPSSPDAMQPEEVRE